MRKFWFIKGLKTAVFFVLLVLFFGFVTMRLWNWLMPELFGLTLISMSQAIGLVLLSRILFGGFHGRRMGGSGWKSNWKEKMKSKFEHMSPEEKEKFKERFKNRCGNWIGEEAVVKTEETTQ